MITLLLFIYGGPLLVAALGLIAHYIRGEVSGPSLAFWLVIAFIPGVNYLPACVYGSDVIGEFLANLIDSYND